MAATRPGQYPDWALQDITDPVSGQPNVEAPDAIHAGTGINSSADPVLPDPATIEGVKYLERTPRRWFNWLMRVQSYWVRWLDTITQNHETSIASIGGQIDAINIEQSAQDASINSLNSEVSGVNITLSAHGVAISNLQTNASADEADIDTLQGQMTSANSSISILNGQMTTATNKNNSQDGEISTLQGQATTALNTNNTQDSNISALQSGLGSANSNISSLQSRTTTAESNISTNTSDISSLQSSRTIDEGKISTLETHTGAGSSYTNQNSLAFRATALELSNSQTVIPSIANLKSFTGFGSNQIGTISMSFGGFAAGPISIAVNYRIENYTGTVSNAPYKLVKLWFAPIWGPSTSTTLDSTTALPSYLIPSTDTCMPMIAYKAESEAPGGGGPWCAACAIGSGLTSFNAGKIYILLGGGEFSYMNWDNSGYKGFPPFCVEYPII